MEREREWNEVEEEPRPAFEIKDILFAVGRSWIWILLLAFVGMAAGILMAAGKPNTYKSQAKLLLRMGAREEITAEDVADVDLKARGTRPTILDEIHLLTDESIYRDLAKKLGPTSVLRPADPRRYDSLDTPLPVAYFHALQAYLMGFDSEGEEDEELDTTTAAAVKLQRSTSVVSERFSNVISVYHTSTSPQKARAHCEAVVEAFIDRHRQQFSISPFVDETRAKTEAARQAHEKARTDYYAHLNECNLVEVDERLSNLQIEIDDLNHELAAAQTRRAEIDVWVKALSGQLADVPETTEIVIPAVMRPNPEYTSRFQRMQTWVVEKEKLEVENILEAERRRKQAQFDEFITALEAELAERDSTIVDVPERREQAPNPKYLEIADRIEELRIEDLGLATRIVRLEEQLDERNGMRGKMLDCQLTHGILEGKREDNADVYHKLSEQLSRLEALESIDERGDSNLQVLKAPTLPMVKAGPDRKKDVLMGALAGLAAGLGLALLRHLLDPRFRYPHSVGRTLGVPVLGVVRERRKLRAFRKLGPLKPTGSG